MVTAVEAATAATVVNTQELQKIVNGALQKWLSRKSDLRMNILVRATYARAKEELDRKRQNRKRRWQQLWSEINAPSKRVHRESSDLQQDDDPLSLNCFFEKLRCGSVPAAPTDNV
ncbi:unnamed protein product [Ixodes hexagonus]